MTLGESEREAIRSVLAGLERDVAVTLDLGPAATPVTLLAAGGREIESNAVARDVVEDVCALSARVSLSVVEHDQPGPWPRTTIGAGIEYLGMPVGYELTTLVHGILEAGRAAPALTDASLARLAAVDDDLTIDVYVTPT